MASHEQPGFSDFTGRVAIVSGAAQGLGAAFADRLAAEGARVMLFDVREEVRATADDIARRSGAEVLAEVADIGRRADVEAVVARTVAAWGTVDVLINNAGTWRATPVDSPWETALADWDAIMTPNLKGLLLLSRACVPHLVAGGGGAIVNVSTYYVLPARSAGTNPPHTDLYNASKWALNGLTDAWAKYLAAQNVRVNGLCMGATDTPMLRGLFEDGELPEDLAAVVMEPQQIAQQLVDLLRDGRSGENVGAWVGEPVELGPPKPAHQRITG